MREGMRLTVYLGDRDRVEGRLLADVLLDCYTRHGVRSSVLLRGVEGFGIKHRLASERLLTLSEDLPLLALAVDTPERIDAVLAEVLPLTGDGTITLERARLLDGDEAGAPLEPGSDAVKLTAYAGRQERIGEKPAYMEIVECLHGHGVAGASVLLGLDGTVHGVRRRARFLARNAQVPMMIQSVGEAHTIAAALAELSGSSSANGPAMTLERVRVCKRDGVRLAEPLAPPQADAAGRGYWQKLVVYSSERSRHQGEPLHSALVRRLRREGAAGATVLRGQWGYHGDHAPHGEAFWSLARSVPVLTVLLDTPENMGRWFEIVDELTAETGLVTSELVPALRASGPGIEHGGLELAERHGGSPG
jgi:PII-like signaling protein